MKEKILSTKLFPDQIGIFYTGQIGFIVKYNGKYILTDGYLSDYIDKNCCSDEVIWERLYPAPISAAELDFIDYVFCTHDHLDHADPATLSEIIKVNSKAEFFGPPAVCSKMSEYGIPSERIHSLKTDERVSLTDDIYVTAIPAAHEELHRDENGSFKENGFIFDFGGIRLFHSGDCCPYDGLESRINNCDVLILPVNGRDYFRRNVQDIIGCFDSREAVTIAKNTNAKLLIPAHFDLYKVNSLNPAYFVDTLQSINPRQAFHIFTPGEGYIYSK